MRNWNGEALTTSKLISRGEPVEQSRGELAFIASRVLVEVLYAARMARFDLLRAVSFLAQRVTQ